jgi:hypothetical protein
VAVGFSETARHRPRLSRLPRAFGPRNDGSLGIERCCERSVHCRTRSTTKVFATARRGKTPSLRGA